MKPLSAKAHISLGQVSLLTTVMLLAVFLGLVPDRVGAVRDGRAALAEGIAANSSALITQTDVNRLDAILQLVVQRNDDLLSAAVRMDNGEAVVTAGDHDSQWVRTDGEHSTDAQLRVPIWASDGKWGQVELRFRPLVRPGIWGWLQAPWFLLIAFVALCGFILFYLYLGKVLRHLDPNRAIPPHVRSALDTLAEGLLVIDLKGQVVLANSAFAEVVGSDADALLGRRVSEFAWANPDETPLEAQACPWVMAVRDGEMQRNDLIQLTDRDGIMRSFIVNCSPVLGNAGKHTGVLISFDDVTQLEEHKAELHKSKEAAVAANLAKSEFLANMSHEIRTPMNAILGFTQVLRRGYAKSEMDWKKYLNTIHSSGKHLLQLINDVLDLSKVEAGHADVERIECAVHVIARDVVSVLRVKAEERGIALELRVDGPFPEVIHSDPTRLRQIMTNLVGNAIKFTETGGVSLSLRLASGDIAQRLVMEVADTGIGLPSDRLEAIFEPFSQADSSINRRFGGTGLGLAISRRFARALGGDIVVRSEPGAGSVFTVIVDPGTLDGVCLLDPEVAMSVEVGAVSERPMRWRFRGARVLVVDDAIENRELLQVVLEDVGLNVDEAEDGRVGADRALAHSYDVILMDMQMPVMDGHAATRYLREQGVEVPIIALTANAMKGFERECLEAGCTGYLTKPIDTDLLLQELAGLLGGELEPETAQPVGPGSAATNEQADESVQDDGPIVSSLAATDPRYEAIAQRFVGRLHDRMNTMIEAARERDFDELSGFAHWLRGSAGTVGFDALVEPAGRLEHSAHARDGAAAAAAAAALAALVSRIAMPGTGDRAEAAVAAPVPTEVLPELSASQQAPAAGAEEVAVASQPPPGPFADPRLAAIRDRFAARLGERVSAMERAWIERDLEQLGQLAHWLKGSAGTVGFDQFTAHAAKLEQDIASNDENGIAARLERMRALTDEIVPSPARRAG